MVLESEWRDDETFGSIVEELNSLKTQALDLIEEIYETYPKYFRKRAQQILERPIYRNETVIMPNYNSSINSRPVTTNSGISGYSSVLDYLGKHNYGMGDYDTYSKDPIWRALMKKEFPNTKLPLYDSLQEYYDAHHYKQSDYDKYSIDPEWQQLMANAAHENIARKLSNVEFISVAISNNERTSKEIIQELGGYDRTSGSCSSLAFAYAGNKGGYRVLDFRGGESMNFFAKNKNIQIIAELPGVKSEIAYGVNDIDCTKELLSKMEMGKEYYLATSEHAAIVRKNDSIYEYLELQSPTQNGWKQLTQFALQERFGCKPIRGKELPNFLIDVNSLTGCKEFIYILGYINTAEEKQNKGDLAYVK